jgi:hypothetical protein
MSSRALFRLGSTLLAFSASVALGAEPALPEKVEFNKHIRPILSDKCFFCHGPDHNKRKAGLRLDVRSEAIEERDGIRALVPGEPHASETIVRMLSEDPEEKMPPADSKLSLSAKEIALVRRWIEQGADYQTHWSFTPPQRTSVPSVAEAAQHIPRSSDVKGAWKIGDWSSNPIDAFVLKKLAAEGLEPSPRADIATLGRRMHLDLTGLPPTPAEADAFMEAAARDLAGAISALADRLMASPSFGEHMAWPWLEAARYADTHGYQSDLERTMWPWRNWVINAFNRNLPFDQFTIEQIAGDLIPNATRDQKIASGFNRNHRINGEAGIIPEEYAVEYVVDRVDTTATVWLGLTAGCARCHDHKYDPLTQKEFFQIFAFFNNVPEQGKDGRRGWAVPVVRVPMPAQESELARLTVEIEQAQRALTDHVAGVDERIAKWESTTPDANKIVTDALEKQLVGRFFISEKQAGNNVAPKPAKEAKANLRGAQWETLPMAGQALKLEGGTWATLGGKLGDLDREDHFAFSLWIKPSKKQRMPVLEHIDDLANNRGWYVALDEEGRVEVQLAYNDENNLLRVVSEKPLGIATWQHLAISYDGSGEARGVTLLLDGQVAQLKVVQDTLTEPLQPRSATLRFGGGELRPTLHGSVYDLRFYRRALSQIEAGALAARPAMEEILAKRSDKRSAEEKGALAAFFLEHHDPAYQELAVKLDTLRHAFADIDQQVVKSMVMQDSEKPRATHVLKRGEYDKPGEPVTPAVPAWLGELPDEVPANRLGFAKWLVSGKHPLTARVAVNRFWQLLFGAGLVKTAEDFGSQGELPVQQELLDWLAVAFAAPKSDEVATFGVGWDMKALLKLIVTSATYQQSSQMRPDLRERDPENRLLARGPRFRLPANVIRDQALASAGLLVEKVGGPSVRPYQPPGIWEEVSFQRKGVSTDFYVPDKGEGLYRRSMYTFWKRTVNPPTMQIFDASGRDMCNVRPRVTNTPLQALALLNDVTFVEASRGLAQRMLTEAPSDPAARLQHGWRITLGREPRDRELQVLTESLERHRAKYAAEPAAAEALLTVGESAAKPGLNRSELAAYTAVANTILNLDEAITKE